MEKRRSERKSCHVDATFISAGKSYNGWIENISEDGCEFFMTSLVRAPSDFTPEKRIQLSFPVSSGQMINLSCETIWFLRASQQDSLLIGARITNPPEEYDDLIRTM